MQPLQQRGVPHAERELPGAASATPDWESIHVFLEVVRKGSFRSAADQLGQSINAVRRRISELEHQLGVTLLTRHVDGVRTTAEGTEILEAARKMEAASFGLIRARDRAVPSVDGLVKLAVTEGLGTFWLAPRLVEFQRTHPKLCIDLNCAMRSADVARLEADVAVQLDKPTNPDLKIVKLGRLHSMPFAAQSYIDLYGAPKTVEDGLKHRIVLQVADQTAASELFSRTYPGVSQQGHVVLRTNVGSAYFWSIAKGGGIGILPTYARAVSGRVTPIDVGLRFQFDIWLTYHPDAIRIPRVRRVVDWLVDAFDPKKFPWFRDEFIHPDDFPASQSGAIMANLFEGFVTGNAPRGATAASG
jgi:DNA-binding transcriptional LysR family regulator